MGASGAALTLCLSLASLGGPSSPEQADEPSTDVERDAAPGDVDSTAPAAIPDGLEVAVLEAPVLVEYPAYLAQTASPPAGVVTLRFLVTVDGSVRDVSVISGVHPEIDAAVVEAMRGATYVPARYEGQPVELVMRIDIDVEAPAPPAKPEPSVQAPVEGAEPAAPTPASLGPVRIEGVVREGGDRRPLAGVRVTAVPAEGLRLGRVSRRAQKRRPPSDAEPPWTASAETDAAGRFALRGVRETRVRLIFAAPGYERLDRVVEVRRDEVLSAKFYLTRAHDSLYRTTVEVERETMEDVTRRKLSPDQLHVMPGSQGDALKGIQNLPGVGRVPFGLGDVLLRGAGPGDSATYIAEHEVPILFHFFGLTSVVNTQMLESVDVVPSAYDARYGDAIGGIVDVRLRKGRRDGFHGEVSADLINAGAVLEGPVSKGSFLIGARRSYFGSILKALDPSFTVAPRYWDYQGVFHYPLGPGALSVRAFGSDDVMEGIDEQVDEQFDFQLGFHRVDMQYEAKTGPWRFLITPGYRRDEQDAAFSANDRTDLKVDSGMWRIEATYHPKRWVTWQFGTAGEGSDYRLALTTTPLDQVFEVGSDVVRSDRHSNAVTGAMYSSVEFATRSGFSVTPGMRLTYFITPAGRLAPDPRLRAQWALPSGTTLKAAGGLYSQRANPELWIEDFGNPDLRPERAWHVSAGVEQALPADFTVEATGFLRGSWDLGMPSDAVAVVDGQEKPLVYENTGVGRAYGGEFVVKRDFAKNISGWVAYTLMRSEIRDAPGEPFHLALWDQTHNLIALVHWRLPKNWSVGARFRLVSGNLDTPTTDGVLDSRTGNYAPVLGPEFSQRLPLFHQLDLRVDKSWTVRVVKIGAYLDIQNVYNAANPEFRQYSFNFKRSVPVRSIPVFPSLGVKVSF